MDRTDMLMIVAGRVGLVRFGWFVFWPVLCFEWVGWFVLAFFILSLRWFSLWSGCREPDLPEVAGLWVAMMPECTPGMAGWGGFDGQVIDFVD
jgi:hypothetical protein